MKKVYGLLAVQLSITTLIGAVMLFTPGVKELVQVGILHLACGISDSFMEIIG